MKRNLKAIFTAFIVFVTTRNALAQSIVIPTTFLKQTDLHLDNKSLAASQGIIIISPSETAYSGNTKKGAANFTLTGQVNYLYTITLLASCVIDRTGYVTAERFTSYPTSTGILNANGMQLLSVGATFRIGSKQSTGSYSCSGTALVTINYN